MRYPVALRLAGRRCVVVGGGRIATRKVRALIDVDAQVVVVAPDATDEIRSLATAGAITWVARGFEAQDLDGAWLVVSATDQPDIARAVSAAADARQVWHNAAELPAVSTWASAKVIRRGDITIGVSTDGQSPAFTTWLADRIEADLGPEYAEVCALLAETRTELQAADVPTESLPWRAVLDGGIVELVRSGRMDEARELLRSCR